MKIPSLSSALPLALLALSISGSAFAEKTAKQPVLADPVEVMGAVQIIGEPHKQPFVATIAQTTISPGQSSIWKPIALPPGKRIVIETVSVWGEVAAGSRAQGALYLNAGPDNLLGSLHMTFTEQGPRNGRIWYTANSATRIRLNSDQHQLALLFARPGNATGRCGMSIFGYIEDL